MAKSPEQARDDWVQNTNAEDWAAGVSAASDNYGSGVSSAGNQAYQEGVGAFLNVSSSSVNSYDWESQAAAAEQDWVNGVQSDSARQKFEDNTGSEQGNDWLNNYRDAMTR